MKTAKKYYFNEADHDLKSAVWWKGKRIDGYDPKVWLRDRYDRVMKWSEHGNRDSQFGWEIDHIYPVALGGTDSLSNLQPLNWRSNVQKGNKVVGC